MHVLQILIKYKAKKDNISCFATFQFCSRKMSQKVTFSALIDALKIFFCRCSFAFYALIETLKIFSYKRIFSFL